MIKERKLFVEVYPETNQIMTRPNISIPLAIIKFVVVIVVTTILALIFSYVFNFILKNKEIIVEFYIQFIIIFLSLLAFDLLIFLRNILIFILRLYQKYAPYEVRCNCVFIPSCSEYMILAIKKYGVIIGIIKGICRLKRCYRPNGGVDYP